VVQGSVSVVVDRSPDVVFAAISDITRTGEWSPECVAGRWVSGATGPAVGARFEGDNKAVVAGLTLKNWTTTVGGHGVRPRRGVRVRGRGLHDVALRTGVRWCGNQGHRIVPLRAANRHEDIPVRDRAAPPGNDDQRHAADVESTQGISGVAVSKPCSMPAYRRWTAPESLLDTGPDGVLAIRPYINRRLGRTNSVTRYFAFQ
jgi:hypothetical protein